MYYIKRLYIFFSTLALIIFFFSTEVVKAKSFEINDIEISQPFEINFDKNKVIDLGFKKAFYELVYSLIKSTDIQKIDNIKLNENAPPIADPTSKILTSLIFFVNLAEYRVCYKFQKVLDLIHLNFLVFL